MGQASLSRDWATLVCDTAKSWSVNLFFHFTGWPQCSLIWVKIIIKVSSAADIVSCHEDQNIVSGTTAMMPLCYCRVEVTLKTFGISEMSSLEWYARSKPCVRVIWILHFWHQGRYSGRWLPSDVRWTVIYNNTVFSFNPLEIILSYVYLSWFQTHISNVFNPFSPNLAFLRTAETPGVADLFLQHNGPAELPGCQGLISNLTTLLLCRWKIKFVFPGYRDYCVKDNTVVRPSYL